MVKAKSFISKLFEYFKLVKYEWSYERSCLGLLEGRVISFEPCIFFVGCMDANWTCWANPEQIEVKMLKMMRWIVIQISNPMKMTKSQNNAETAAVFREVRLNYVSTSPIKITSFSVIKLPFNMHNFDLKYIVRSLWYRFNQHTFFDRLFDDKIAPYSTLHNMMSNTSHFHQ